MKVAINGFGRIGRCALRLLINDPSVEVVAINTLSTSKEMAYLFKYDTTFRTLRDEVSYDDDHIIFRNKRIKVFSESDPSVLPWKQLDVDVVLECTGVFNSGEKCMSHINAGAKKVVISAPAKDDIKTVVYGVNNNILEPGDKIISAASCTTNCLAPVLDVLHKNFNVVKGFMVTVHAMTNDQETLDVSHKKGIESRRGRASSLNTIPTSTGAATQISKIIPSLNNLLDGISYRVPVGDGSLINLSVLVSKETTEEEVNKIFESNQNDVLKYTTAPIVSSDIIGTLCASTVDGLCTKVIDKNLINVVAWYDNELGYTAQMIRTMKALMK